MLFTFNLARAKQREFAQNIKKNNMKQYNQEQINAAQTQDTYHKQNGGHYQDTV